MYHRLAFWKCRFVDPDGRGKGHRFRHFSLEPFRMFYKGRVQNGLPLFDNLLSPPVMDIFRGQVTDSGMVVFGIVPVEEILAEKPYNKSKPRFQEKCEPVPNYPITRPQLPLRKLFSYLRTSLTPYRTPSSAHQQQGPKRYYKYTASGLAVVKSS